VCDAGLSPIAVDNEAHCDFRKLRSLLVRTHMHDLCTTTEETHYEAYRQAQMETRKFGEAKIRKLDNPKFKEEEEGLRKRFTEQVKLEEARFRQWEQHVRRRVSCRLPLPTSISSLTAAASLSLLCSTAHRRARPAQQGAPARGLFTEF
jgi:hypothetical protein